jgi:hypothetical protein
MPRKEAFMRINSGCNDLLRLFGESGVRYLIAGSYAVMKYTESAWSKEIGVWVEPAPENAAKVLDALRRLGAPLGNLGVSDLTGPTTLFQIGVAGNRIDIMTDIPGLVFDEAWKRRDTFQYGGVASPVLSIEDTLTASRSSNRPSDRQRIRALRKAIEVRSRLGKSSP